MSTLTQLSRLEGDGLIQVAAVQPELEYLFRHGLIKDAAYFSLLKGHRRVLHQAVGETLERLYQPPRRELLPELAHHFGEGGDAARALRYFTLAADAAAGAYANAEAIAQYSQALSWAAHTPIDSEQLIHLHVALGRAQELSGDYAAALATYAALERAGRERAEPALELAGTVQRVVAYAVPSGSFNPTEAIRLAAEVRPLAQRLGDRAAEARLAWAGMLAHYALGQMSEAIGSGNAALALARSLGERELLATVQHDLARGYMTLGAPDQAEAALTEARELWRALNNVPMLAETYTTYGGLAFYRGNYDDGLAQLQEGFRLSQSINNAWGMAYSLMFRSYLLLDRGDLSAAITTMQHCLEYATQGGFIYPEAGIAATLAVAYTYLGQPQAAAAALAQAQDIAERLFPTELMTVRLMEAWCAILRRDYAAVAEPLAFARAHVDRNDRLTSSPLVLALVEGELALAQGQPAQALVHANQRSLGGPASGTQAFTTDLRRLQGEALMALGRLDEAEDTLLHAHAQALAQPSYRTLWPISAALARLAARRADAAGAARWRAEAHRHRDYLADHIDDPQQRVVFLALAEERAPTNGASSP
jgi:tetratricopeptide (TPR) repeat protein